MLINHVSNVENLKQSEKTQDILKYQWWVNKQIFISNSWLIIKTPLKCIVG